MAGQGRSNNLVIVLGVVTALVGAALGALLLLNANDDKGSSSASGTTEVPVLVAKKMIPRGASGADLLALVDTKRVKQEEKTADAFSTIAELGDRTAVQDIPEGQQLRSVFFRERAIRGEAIQIPDGKQAVAVTVDFVPAGAGYISAGDHVNIYALFNKQDFPTPALTGSIVVPPCNGATQCPATTASTTPTVNVTGAPPANTTTTAPKAPDILAASRLVLTNVEVLDVSQEVAPNSDTTPTTTATGAPAAVSARAVAPSTSVTFLVAVDASQAERLIYFTSYEKLYLTLMGKGQPDSTTPGRDGATALKP